MRALAGADIQGALGTEGPVGLASEPADYPRCFAAAKLVAPRSFFNQIRYDRAQVTEKCHRLHRAIKEQALGFLISAHWTIVDAAARGVSADRAEVRSAFVREQQRLYPTEAALHRYLNERHWSLSDLLYRIKLDLLAKALGTPSGRRVAGEGRRQSGRPQLAQTLPLTYASKTICRRGYIVPGCSRFRGRPSAASSAVEEIERLTGKPV
jgi:hypothetical protein